MSKIDGIGMGDWSPFSFLCLKVGRVTGCLAIRFRGEATGHLAIGFCGEVTGHLPYVTGHLYCSFSGLILKAVL